MSLSEAVSRRSKPAIPPAGSSEPADSKPAILTSGSSPCLKADHPSARPVLAAVLPLRFLHARDLGLQHPLRDLPLRRVCIRAPRMNRVDRDIEDVPAAQSHAGGREILEIGLDPAVAKVNLLPLPPHRTRPGRASDPG